MSDLKVSKISNGTVIDHISPGKGLVVMSLLGLDGSSKRTTSLLMNVESSKMERKDILKVEDRKLKEEEVMSVSVLAPEATVNIIDNQSVVEKKLVELPEKIEGVLECPNPHCVTNTDEPLDVSFEIIDKKPVMLKCGYCERKFTTQELDI